MVVTLFVLFVFYTVACCMDGPDLKPRWKRWLGMRLEGYADSLKTIDYCLQGKCKFYNKATYDLPMLQERYEDVIHNIATMNALNCTPRLFVSDYEIKKIEEVYLLRESDLFEAYMHEDMAKRQGIPMYQIPDFLTVDGIVNSTKERCAHAVLDKVNQFVTIEEDRESRYPEIVVRGSLHVGVKR